MSGVHLSEGELNRTTLERQLLLRRERIDVVDAAARVVALQAQAPASPYLAMWARVDRFDPADLDAAFTSGAVVKASLMRVTLHAVAGSDYSSFYQAMQATLRAARLVDPSRLRVGASSVDADELVNLVVRFAAEPRTDVELQDRLEQLIGVRDRRLWRAVRTFAPLHHVPDGGPWSFARSSSFVAAPAPAAGPRSAPLAAASRLLLHYLQGFGPASVRDCVQFTMLRQPVVRAARAALGELVAEHVGPAGEQLLDVAGGRITPADTCAPPRLLGMWDSTLLAFADRARVLGADYRPWVIRRNGDVLPTLLVDGHVVGVWRAVLGGIEVTAFDRLTPTAWDEIAEEVVGLQSLLADREPQVYGRYGHWWGKELPFAEQRVLAG